MADISDIIDDLKITFIKNKDRDFLKRVLRGIDEEDLINLINNTKKFTIKGFRSKTSSRFKKYRNNQIINEALKKEGFSINLFITWIQSNIKIVEELYDSSYEHILLNLKFFLVLSNYDVMRVIITLLNLSKDQKERLIELLDEFDKTEDDFFKYFMMKCQEDNKKLKDCQKEVTKLKDKLADAESTVEKNEERISDLRNSRDNLDEKLKEYKRNLNKTRTNLKKTNKLKLALESDLSQVEGEKKKLKSELERFKNQVAISSIVNAFNQTAAQIEDNWSQEINGLKEIIEQTYIRDRRVVKNQQINVDYPLGDKKDDFSELWKDIISALQNNITKTKSKKLLEDINKVKSELKLKWLLFEMQEYNLLTHLLKQNKFSE